MESAVQVLDIQWYNESVFELSLDRLGVAFTPGDCLALFAGDGKTSRPYSLASGVEEDRLRFVIRRMPAGTVSGWLSERRPGDRVSVSPPFGWFRPGGAADEKPFVFVATGTGISPFLSWLRSRPETPPASCLYGARTLDDAVEWAWIQEHCPLRLALSREEIPGHETGRVTDLLEDMPWSPDHEYYLCGLDAMIDDVTRFLEAKGTAMTRIHRECFFNASCALPT